MRKASSLTEGFVEMLKEMEKNAPEGPGYVPQIGASLKHKTSPAFPRRYRLEWDRPTDEKWNQRFERTKKAMQRGAMVAIVGNRGTGKTRLAAEVSRDLWPERTVYLTATEAFVKIKSSYRKDSKQSEESLLNEWKKAALLVIDEIQERAETDWEKVVLTHLLDDRYANQRPTLVIGNLKPNELEKSLGSSISDRITEGGGILQMVGDSFRGG